MHSICYFYSCISGSSYANTRWEESSQTPNWSTFLGHRIIAIIEYTPIIGRIALIFDYIIHEHLFPQKKTEPVSEKNIIQQPIVDETPVVLEDETPTPSPSNILDLAPEQTAALAISLLSPLSYMAGMPYGISLKFSFLGTLGFYVAQKTYSIFKENSTQEEKKSVEELITSSLAQAIPPTLKYYALHATPLNAIVQSYTTGKILFSSLTGTVTALQEANKENYPLVLRNLAVYGINTTYSCLALRHACLVSSSIIPDNEDFAIKYIQPVASKILSKETMDSIGLYSDQVQNIIYEWFPPFMGLKTCINPLAPYKTCPNTQATFDYFQS